MAEPPSGYKEKPHTADWELKVWAPSLPELFAQAAQGMYALSGAQMEEGSQIRRPLDLQAADLETLLVSFLDELLFLGEQESLAFGRFDLQIDEVSGNGCTLQGSVYGARLAHLAKEIKAVTYHNLSVERTQRGFEVNIVFDV
jgi:SHS2 domain-containing protein